MNLNRLQQQNMRRMKNVKGSQAAANEHPPAKAGWRLRLPSQNAKTIIAGTAIISTGFYLFWNHLNKRQHKKEEKGLLPTWEDRVRQEHADDARKLSARKLILTLEFGVFAPVLDRFPSWVESDRSQKSSQTAGSCWKDPRDCGGQDEEFPVTFKPDVTANDRFKGQGLCSRQLDSLALSAIEPVNEFEGEIGRSFEVLRRIQALVKESLERGASPVTAAVVAALGAAGDIRDDLDIFWTDTHPDAQVPDDNRSGYLDSMGTAILAGMARKAHMATVEGHIRILIKQITFIGIRDMQVGEAERIITEGPHLVYGGKEGVDYAAKLEKISIGPGGLLEKGFKGCLQFLAERNPVSLTVTPFNPNLSMEAGGEDAIADLAVKAVTEFFETSRAQV
ncbi:hypothetical protein FIBSPDRAFT_939784 [Athelia psychrophila]|uniref:Uncharacterized protein n=1 Tax=Athelia psychrophila TaxID=1759441 RepID=A0A167X702_9AGAM|nr:hypothetical protein FIBSPDRAFT_939784 [Fibularhizoctonia sp. CBS 109695]